MHKIAAGARAKVALLLILATAHILITLFYVVPGPLLIDEIIYHWSARDFTASGQLSVWNGYEERPSPELIHPFLSSHSGKLYAQYPMFFVFLAATFYKVWGYYGLFILNSIAFLITLGLCLATARRLFDDVDLALNSCLILVLGTFFWEYSQAAWPHMTSACFAMGALYLLVCAYMSDSKSSSVAAAAGAGILAGMGLGMRYDSIFVIPALLMPLFVSKRPRVAEVSAFSLATLPPLLLCAYINYLRFGVFSPVADGHITQAPGYILTYPLVAIPLAWCSSRLRIMDLAIKHKTICLVAAFGALVVAMLIPTVRAALANWLHYANINVIDMTAFDANIIRPAMSRSPGGGVVYIGAQKKALLQSMPFLALLVVPIINLLRNDKDAPKLFMLMAIPITYIAGQAYTFLSNGTYEGGLCLNLSTLYPFCLRWRYCALMR